MTIRPQEDDPLAYATTWDLTELLPSLEAEHTEPALDAVEKRVAELEGWRDRLDAIEDPGQVADLLDALADLDRELSRVHYRASLAFSADTEDQRAAAFLSRMEDLEARVANRVRFLELWWKGLDAERAEALTPDDPERAHYLGRLRAFAPYTLSEAEERVMSLKDVTGRSALTRARDILTSDITFEDPRSGEEVTVSELLTGVHHHDPEVRRASYDELWRVWQDHATLLAHVYRSVVNDWYNTHVELRGHPTPIHRRHLQNDVPPEAVDALLEVCRDKRELFQDFFVWKGDRLGIEMDRYQVYAPLRTEEGLEVPFDDAADAVLDVLGAFDGEVQGLAKRVFDERHVDALPRKKKRSGAYCATVHPDVTPFLFLNHTDDRDSLKTLAHEMGHALHSMLAEERHPLVHHAGLPLAETASVFSEMLLHDRLVRKAEEAGDEAEKERLIADKVTEVYQTVQRQAYFALFELKAHPALREGATVQEVHDLYLENLREQFGPVDVPDKWRLEWTYIPHFVHTPFYVYAYSFGMLLSLSLYDRYRREGDDFVPTYKRILAAGGSVSPAELIEREVGADITDRAFWERGFAVVEGMVDELGAG